MNNYYSDRICIKCGAPKRPNQKLCTECFKIFTLQKRLLPLKKEQRERKEKYRVYRNTVNK